MLRKPRFVYDDRGNEVIFYEKMLDGSWGKVANLNREAGPPPCNQVAWHCDNPECEIWAKQQGYEAEILLAKAIALLANDDLRAKVFSDE